MKLYQIDSFTREKFKGNPAGVCLPEQALNDEEMQAIASEMNLSETAFIQKRVEGYDLRWFTPASEVPLCGHATLASAFVMFTEGIHPKDEPISFHTLSGELIVHYQEDGSLLMDFPAKTPISYQGDSKEAIMAVFGETVVNLLEVPNELIVIVDSVERLKQIDPSADVIASFSNYGVMVSAWDEDGEYDFVSRYFAPNLGIKEDPVTGFIHTILSPYWSQTKGQTDFSCYQASVRGGELKTSVKGDRVWLFGHAVKVFETEISL